MKLSAVDSELWAVKDTGLFVKALVLDQPVGTEALATTAIIGARDYTATWSKVTRLPVQHKVGSEGKYGALMPAEIRVAFVEFIKFVTEFGLNQTLKLSNSWLFRPPRWRFYQELALAIIVLLTSQITQFYSW